jgi:hypothetical protein
MSPSIRCCGYLCKTRASRDYERTGGRVAVLPCDGCVRLGKPARPAADMCRHSPTQRPTHREHILQAGECLVAGPLTAGSERHVASGPLRGDIALPGAAPGGLLAGVEMTRHARSDRRKVTWVTITGVLIGPLRDGLSHEPLHGDMRVLTRSGWRATEARIAAWPPASLRDLSSGASGSFRRPLNLRVPRVHACLQSATGANAGACATGPTDRMHCREPATQGMTGLDYGNCRIGFSIVGVKYRGGQV